MPKNHVWRQHGVGWAPHRRTRLRKQVLPEFGDLSCPSPLSAPGFSLLQGESTLALGSAASAHSSPGVSALTTPPQGWAAHGGVIQQGDFGT